MRIALVSPYSLDVAGGVNQHVLGLARWLHAQGDEPVVLAPGTSAVAEPFEVRPLGPAVGVRWNGAVARLSVDPRAWHEAAAEAERADIVHVHEPLTPGLAHHVARRAAGLVVTHHAAFTPGATLTRALAMRARRLPARQSIAVSRAAATTAAAFLPEAPTVIPNGISLPPESRTPKDPRFALFLGRRSDPRKGHAVWIRIRELLGPSVETLELSDGTASREEVESALARASVLVAPHTGGESFGLVLVEALAAGCGIVASDLPAFREVVADPALVDFFPVWDAEAAVAAVRHRLGRTDPAAARAAAQAFTWDRIGPLIRGRYALARSDRLGP